MSLVLKLDSHFTLLSRFLSLSLLVLVLSFGGTSLYIFNIFSLLIFALTITLIIASFNSPSSPKIDKHFPKSASALLASGCCFILFVFARLFAGHASGSSSIKELNFLHIFFDELAFISPFLLFLCCFFISVILFLRFPELRLNAWRFVFITGFIISIVALSHWFYDNGHLFWVFAPQKLFTSHRARWPFVNANHLGHFLLPTFFLGLFLFEKQLSGFKQNIRDNFSSRRNYRIARYLSSKKTQYQIFLALLNFFMLLSILLALLATLSRSTLIGLSFSALIYLLLKRKGAHTSPKSDQFLEDADYTASHGKKQDLPQKRRRRRSRKKEISAFSKISFSVIRKSVFLVPYLLLLALCLTFIMSSERGTELVDQRLEFSLSATKNDIRWQMYKDSLPMFWENPVLGVGLGRWSKTFSQYKSEELVGIFPRYLHSEPLQLLIEGGLVGLLLLALPLIFLLFQAFKCRSKLKRLENNRLAALISAVLSLIVASCFDFPFRMPAIAVFFALYLAMISAALSEDK